MYPPEIDWHQRFRQQATWTKPLRDYLFNQASLASARRVLEVGCGTGVVLSELEQNYVGSLFGLDLDLGLLSKAVHHTSHTYLLQSDGHAIPFPKDAFDITFCHFLLLWVKEPIQVVSEMARITRPGGHIMALAEPDYGGRIDYPVELEQVGLWQRNSLRLQGAEPYLGRQLADIFTKAGVKDVQTGVLGGEWKGDSTEDWISEWSVVEQDLKWLKNDESLAQLESLKHLNRESRKAGVRVLYVPTFYAWGRK